LPCQFVTNLFVMPFNKSKVFLDKYFYSDS